MRILMERGRNLLRRSVTGVGALASASRFSQRRDLPVSSPRIRRAIVDLCESRSATRPNVSSVRHAQPGGPLAYRVRARLVESRVPAGAGDAELMMATRFDVVDADKGLLAFLGQPAPGFHVFELRCAGLESLWRGDLVKVQESRRPILASMTIYAGTEAIEIEHLAFPVLESGRILEIRGWFDEACGQTLPDIDWKGVRHVRRNARARAVTLPRQLTRPASTPGTSDISVLYSEDPGIGMRFEARATRVAPMQGRSRESRPARGQA